jgi:hypothetical protein
MIASMFLFIFSLAFVGGGGSIIKNVASSVDFNPNSICKDISKNDGIIYLDPVYNLIIVNGKNEEEKHTYTIKECQPALNKPIKRD